MHIDKYDIPVVMDVPGATARQTAAGGEFAAECFTIAAGVDIAPLLEGLDGDACQVPHWGYVVGGAVEVTYTDGHGPAEICRRGECFYWPGGHSVRVLEDADVVLFSPHAQHRAVIEHMKSKLAAMG